MSNTSHSVAKELQYYFDTNTWIHFMDVVKQHLPFLMQPGRPTKKQISDSVIGEMGYTSWTEFVDYNLDWNVSGWHAWRRAYRFVEENEYLREIYPSASLINLRARTEALFPNDKTTWLNISQKRSQKREHSRITQLEKRVTELEEKLATLVLNNES